MAERADHAVQEVYRLSVRSTAEEMTLRTTRSLVDSLVFSIRCPASVPAGYVAGRL